MLCSRVGRGDLRLFTETLMFPMVSGMIVLGILVVWLAVVGVLSLEFFKKR